VAAISTWMQVTDSAVIQARTLREALDECCKVLMVDVKCVADVTDISYFSRITD